MIGFQKCISLKYEQKTIFFSYAEYFRLLFFHFCVLRLYDHFAEPMHYLITKHHGGLMQPASQSYLKNNIGLIPFQSAGISGHAQYGALRLLREDVSKLKNMHRVKIAPGQKLRLRLLNTASLFSFRFTIDNHKFMIIAADGAPVHPYEADAIILGSGERYDLIITGQEGIESAWIRSETLEDGAGDGLPFNGALGVLDYTDTQDSIPTTTRKPHVEAVTVNCIDIMDPANIPGGHDTCRPLTVLHRRVPSHFAHHFPQPPMEKDVNQRYEVSGRATSGGYPAHFVRVTDLKNGSGNTFGQEQWEGPWVQHHHPHLPVSLFADDGKHPHTVSIKLDYNGWVEIVLNQFDRTQHPWHMHGHKFYVMGVGYPDRYKDCNILRCVRPWYGIHAGEESLTDLSTAPLKDTVMIPAGGWVVIRYRTDNPGMWLFHCHMLYHLDDGMALHLEELGRPDPHIRLDEFPEDWMCRSEINSFNKKQLGGYSGKKEVACNCFYDPTTIFHTTPKSSYKCSHDYLCLHTPQTLDPPGVEGYVRGRRQREAGIAWRLAFAISGLLLFISLYAFRAWRKKRQANQILELHPGVPGVGTIFNLNFLNLLFI